VRLIIGHVYVDVSNHEARPWDLSHHHQDYNSSYESKKNHPANQYKFWKRKDSYTEYDLNPVYSTATSRDNKQIPHGHYDDGPQTCRFPPSNGFSANSRTAEMTYAASVTMKCASNEIAPPYFQNYRKTTFVETT